MSNVSISSAVDTARFLEDFHHTSRFGATSGGGIDRQAGTAEHGAVRDWFESRAQEFGFRVETDEIGNIFAYKEWIPGASFVLLGSHLDSQPLGGRFDGTYGVIAALHAAISLDEQVKAGGVEPSYNICVVDWFNEEGARFRPSIMGSGVYTGRWELEETLAISDPDGVTVREALISTGRLGGKVELPVEFYGEIHIEQGRRLERAEIGIAAVSHNWCKRELSVSVIGEQSHTGATLMADRRDALLGAAEVALAVEAVVEDFEAETIVSSVGQFDVEPNSPVVVPRLVELVVDLRANSQEDVDRARDTVLEKFETIARRRNLEIISVESEDREIQHFPQQGIDLVLQSAKDAGQESVVLSTLAGHDAVFINDLMPAVLIFIPSTGGVSHCEREFSSDEDMVTGLQVLANAAARLVTGQLARAGE